jgi:release factor glutamine methyltransferase
MPCCRWSGKGLRQTAFLLDCRPGDWNRSNRAGAAFGMSAGNDAWAYDVSADAVKTALENARELGLSARYRAITGDWLCGIDAQFDLIVSNPPYIPTGDLARCPRESDRTRPDAGARWRRPTGLNAYRQIASQCRQDSARWPRYAAGNRQLGRGQPVASVVDFCGRGVRTVGGSCDLGGVDRVLVLRCKD